MNQNTDLLHPDTRDALMDDYAFMQVVELPTAIADDDLDHIIEVADQIHECEEILFLDLAARFHLV
jgi:hypothetical protein